MNVLPVVLTVVLVPYTFLAAFWDMRTHRLPNWITVPAFLLGLMFHVVYGALTGAIWYQGAASGLGHSLAGFTVGFFPLLLLWLIGGGGAGDVKLMGAVGAWLGPMLTLFIYVLSSMLVAVVGIGTLLFRAVRPANRSRQPAENSMSHTSARFRGSIVPFGLPVCVSTWLVLAWNLIKLGS